MTNTIYNEEEFSAYLSKEEPTTASGLARVLSEKYGQIIPRSTTSRRLKTLEKQGKVRQTPDGGFL